MEMTIAEACALPSDAASDYERYGLTAPDKYVQILLTSLSTMTSNLRADSHDTMDEFLIKMCSNDILMMSPMSLYLDILASYCDRYIDTWVKDFRKRNRAIADIYSDVSLWRLFADDSSRKGLCTLFARHAVSFSATASETCVPKLDLQRADIIISESRLVLVHRNNLPYSNISDTVIYGDDIKRFMDAYASFSFNFNSTEDGLLKHKSLGAFINQHTADHYYVHLNNTKMDATTNVWIIASSGHNGPVLSAVFSLKDFKTSILAVTPWPKISTSRYSLVRTSKRGIFYKEA